MMMKKPWLVGISVLVILVAGGVLVKRYFWPMPKVESPELKAVGSVAAEEVRKLEPAVSKVVLVVCQVPVGAVGIEAAVASFQQAFPPVATERITIKNLAGRAAATKELLALLEKHKAVDIVVTMGGAGFLDEQALLQGGAERSRLMPVLSFTPVQLKALLGTERVPLGVIPNFRATAPANPPQTTREWFDSAFVVVTPATPAGVFE